MSGVLNTAEVYNPLTGTWTSTGNLVVARTGHSATLLPSCKVLIAGGFASGSPMGSAEVYDPSATSCGSTGCWSVAGSMAIGRRQVFSLTSLADGRVLVAGGNTGPFAGAITAKAEIFDQTDTSCGNGNGCWSDSAAADMPAARAGQSATLLADGTVLAAGGHFDSTIFDTALIYDPGLNTWSAPITMGEQRTQARSAALSDGSVLVAGGFGSSFQVLSSAELYLKTVAIDIKPDTGVPTIKLSSKGNTPVAILSSADFDAPSQVNRSSLTFGKTGNESSLVSCSTVPQDVNGDSLPDLVCKFNTQATGFTVGDTVGKLKGKTTAGIAIRGGDSIRVVP